MLDSTKIVEAIKYYCLDHNITEATFGCRFMNAGGFLKRLKNGSTITLRTWNRLAPILMPYMQDSINADKNQSISEPSPVAVVPVLDGLVNKPEWVDTLPLTKEPDPVPPKKSTAPKRVVVDEYAQDHPIEDFNQDVGGE